MTTIVGNSALENQEHAKFLVIRITRALMVTDTISKEATVGLLW